VIGTTKASFPLDAETTIQITVECDWTRLSPELVTRRAGNDTTGWGRRYPSHLRQKAIKSRQDQL